MNTTHVLFLAEPRTGSTMLRLALGKHPATRFCVLYFDVPHRGWLKFHQQKLASGVTHLCTQIYRSSDHKKWAVGPEVWEMFRDTHNRFLCLRRENLLRQYLSHQIAGNVPGRREVNKPRATEPKPITLHIPSLAKFVDKHEGLLATVDAMFPGRLDVAYEQLATDWSGTFQGILKYLELSAIDVQPTTCQQETRPLRAAIRNYGEVVVCLERMCRTEWLN